MHYTPGNLVNLASGERRSADPAVLAQEVYAVAGLAQPEQFFESLIRQGFSVSEHSFADHYNYSAADFSGLQDKPIIMTEKDAVKCRGMAGDNAWYLSIDAQLPAAVTSAVVALARPVHVTE